MILLLKERYGNKRKICVATTHLLYNPRRGDCKLAQIQLLLAHLDRMAFKSYAVNKDLSLRPIYHPTFLCGDFNCLPTSKLYEFITSGELRDFHTLNRCLFSGQSNFSNSSQTIPCPLLPLEMNISEQCQFADLVDKRIKRLELKRKSDVFSEQTFGTKVLTHSFNFKSVYKHVNKRNVEEVTTCLNDQKKTVDFIFYACNSEDVESLEESEGPSEASFESGSNEEEAKQSSRNNIEPEVELLARLELFSVDELRFVDLPERNYASDHFMIAAKFSIK